LTWGNDFALDDISFAPVSILKDSVIIAVETPVVKTNNDTSLCEGKNLQLIATGAGSYSWSSSKGLNNPNVSNPVANPTASTDYIVTGTTSNGCVAKDTVSITVLSKPAITTSNDTIICKNSSVQLFAAGGQSYSWSPSNTLNDAFIQNPLASPITGTTYYVTTVGANSCANMDSVRVEFWPEPSYSISPSKSICLNDSIQLQATGGNKYDWQPNISLNSSTIPNPKAVPQITTTYTVVISDNCNNSETLSTTIVVKELPDVHISKSNDVDCITTQAQLHVIGGTRYNWGPATNINYTNIPNPIVRPQENTWYHVMVTGANGCTAKDSILVLTSFEVGAGSFYIPNAFTPNGDGKNDCFGVRHWGYAEFFELSIYNRWGERMFFSKNTSDCWDGYYKGRQQPSGTYVYQISVKSPCTNGMLHKKGLVTMIR
jgi:gliding motility-associated-like protein